jgi:nucleoside triphosphate pyrophosphatase
VADAPPAPPLLLASTSPQRRAILEQLGIPFEVVAPSYEESEIEADNALRVVQEHAQGKARSVVERADGRPVIGVDTTVVLGGEVYGKPADATEAEQMLERLSGQRHAVISGLCLLTPGWEFVDADTTFVNFRTLTPRDLAAYIASGEW